MSLFTSSIPIATGAGRSMSPNSEIRNQRSMDFQEMCLDRYRVAMQAASQNRSAEQLAILATQRTRLDAQNQQQQQQQQQQSEATETMKRLSDNDRQLVDSILQGSMNIISANDRNRMAKMFSCLDMGNTGTLTANDFLHVNVMAIGPLVSVWESIKNKFDFYGDGHITLTEFSAYFVIQALVAPHAVDMTESNIGGALDHVLQSFTRALQANITIMESHLLPHAY